jgi:hypothetical protein
MPKTPRNWFRDDNYPPLVQGKFVRSQNTRRVAHAQTHKRRTRALDLHGLRIHAPVPRPLTLRQLLEAMHGCAVRDGLEVPREQRYGRANVFSWSRW